MFTALIVDKDPHEARRLSMVLRQVAQFSTVKLAGDVREGLELIRSFAPDIAFVDATARGLSGPVIASGLGGAERTSFVFLAGEGDPAIATYRAAEMDYVLRPVGCSPVLEVVARVRARRQLASSGAASSDGLHDDSIWVSGRGGLARVSLKAVESFEAERDYVRVWTDAARHLVRGTLQALALRLDPKRFVRIHRSAIVNLDLMDEVRRAPNGRMRMRLRSGRELTVSANYAETTRALMGEHSAAAIAAAPAACPFAIFQR